MEHNFLVGLKPSDNSSEQTADCDSTIQSIPMERVWNYELGQSDGIRQK